MKRAEIMATSRTQKTNTSCFSTLKGKGKRAKRHGAKRLRQHLKKDTNANS